MVLGKKVAYFDWEWGQNSAPREGQKMPCFVQSLLVIPLIILQLLKNLFSSVPCNTKFVYKRKNSTFSYCKTPKRVFCVSMK